MKHSRTLLTQVLVVNLILVIVAVLAATLAASPGFNLASRPEQAMVFGFAVGATVLFNVFLLQRRFRPLEKLVEQMERVDLSRPGTNLGKATSGGGPEEVQRLQVTFRRMLERLEAERRRAASAALTAQERERARVARDLHDEVNQSLTGLLLRLEAVREHAPPELAEEIAETKQLANQAMRELLTLARQLRPTVLDDLGLRAAIAASVEELGRGPLQAEFSGSGSFADVPADAQLVVYRVAQEALSNAARHAEAEHVRVELVRRDGAIELTVADDGRGFTFDEGGKGLGIGGMRERALLVGGELRIVSRPGAGTRVELRVPISEGDEHSNAERAVGARSGSGG
jgi:two-component system sensor histidine kinase UhpB